MYQYTSLGRPLDFTYRSNRFIAAISITTIIFGTGVQLAEGSLLRDSLLWGLQAGLSVFLTWAIAREIDPDFPTSAALASLLAFGAVFILPKPAPGVSFWFLIASRLLNRSTGVKPKFFDYISFNALCVWQVIDSSALFGILGCVVLILDYALARKSKIPVYFSAPLLIFSIYWLIKSNQVLHFSPPQNGIVLGLTAIGFLYFLVIHRTRTVKTSCDVSADLLSPLRIQTCQIFNLAAPILGLLLLSENLIQDFIPILTAVAAVSFYNLTLLIGKSLHKPLS
jgi:hypothetical protein